MTKYVKLKQSIPISQYCISNIHKEIKLRDYNSSFKDTQSHSYLVLHYWVMKNCITF